jgi:O-antigen ligase
MIMLFFFYLAVYYYLSATDDLKTVIGGLAALVLINFVVIARDHMSGMYQPHGIFPHQNSMAIAMHLLGALFFAHYLMNGKRTAFDKLCLAAFVCAAAATLRSYSRVAIALMGVTYGVTAMACLVRGGSPFQKLRRLVPLVIVGAIGVSAMLPRIIERFLHAPESSGNTRVELALCAKEMIVDKPLTGVGINNWGIKINEPYDYALRAGRLTNRGEEFKDGIVETVYLLVCAECGVPALLAMVLWFLWYWISCLRLLKRLKNTRYFFIPAGLLGGLTAAYMQSCFEWVLRQQLNLICIMFLFAILSYLNTRWYWLRSTELEARK